MKCDVVRLGAHHAIVCSSGRSRRCKCSREASLLCDWIVGVGREQKPITCDADLCPTCATSPAPNKHLCSDHAIAWDAHPHNPKNGGKGAPAPL